MTHCNSQELWIYQTFFIMFIVVTWQSTSLMSLRSTSLTPEQFNNYPSAAEATMKNMDKRVTWNNNNWWYNHNTTKQSIIVYIWGVWHQKQVSRAGISNYIPQFTVECYYLSLFEIPASGAKIIMYCEIHGPHIVPDRLLKPEWEVVRTVGDRCVSIYHWS